MTSAQRTMILVIASGFAPLLWIALVGALGAGPYVAWGGAVVVAGVLCGLLWKHVQGEEKKHLVARSSLEEKIQESRKHTSRLTSVLDQAPLAVVLCDREDRVVLANRTARDLFARGSGLEGAVFADALQDCPESMRKAVRNQANVLFTIDLDESGDEESYHISRPSLSMELEHHTLYLVTQLTKELGRQEVSIWKKVIRVVNHEFNNSLAPIASMVGTGRKILDKPQHYGRLEKIFDTIEDRTTHLQEFLQNYARFARLGPANLEAHAWSEFLKTIQELTLCALVEPLPANPGVFDASQLQQVLLNLAKNAVEAGSSPEEILMGVKEEEDGWMHLSVLDRGQGMTDEVMRQALMPFYSTKKRGSGLGLALVREIVEGHKGRMHLDHREGGGLEVHIFFPPAPRA